MANGELSKASGIKLALEVRVSLAEVLLDRRKTDEASKQYADAISLLENKNNWTASDRKESAKKATSSIEMRKSALPKAEELLNRLAALKFG